MELINLFIENTFVSIVHLLLEFNVLTPLKHIALYDHPPLIYIYAHYLSYHTILNGTCFLFILW